MRENFPACFKGDGSFDFERFREYLNDKVTVNNEGYELRSLGKSYARLLASLDTTTVIQPDEEHNNRPENVDSHNIYISGDNLDGLKHLLKSYANTVKCIYIDPPYNTGKDEFAYADKFSFIPADLAIKLSVDEKQAQRIIELTKRGSASHSAWLISLYARLTLARDLLTKDRAIFISIDDNEYANLKLICDDIFCESNYLGSLVIQTATDNNPSQVNTEHEYMLVYARNREFIGSWYRKSDAAELIQEQYEKLKRKNLTTDEIQEQLRIWIKAHKSELPQVDHYDNVDEKGVFSSSSNSSNPHPGGYMFDILHPVTHLPCSKPENGWRWPEETFWEYDAIGEVCWGIDESTQPHIKKRLDTAKEQLKSVIYSDNRAETKQLEVLFGKKNIFENPKPHKVLARIFDFIVEDGDYVLDFYSGSASTAHAVFELCLSKRNLKFILIQLPENLDERFGKTSASNKKNIKAKIDYLDSLNYPHTLDWIGIERIKRAAELVRANCNNADMDFGFKHYTLKEPSTETLDKLEKFDPNQMIISDNLLDEFGISTVLTTWLVRDGYGLNSNVQELDFAGYKGYWKEKHLYLIGKDISQEAILALIDKYEIDGKFNPDNVVIFGYSFTWTATEELRINLIRL